MGRGSERDPEDGVAMLIDWDESTGATLEKRVAEVCGIETHYVRAWFRQKPDCPENDNSPEETANPPSDGVLGALTRRMDEMNALLRAVYGQISALNAIVAGELTKSTCDYPKQVVREALDKAKDISRSAQVFYESAWKDGQDDRKA